MSIERRFAGSTDVELTEDGRAQAKALAKRLRQVRVDALFSSPLTRCQQTADAITEVTGRKATLTEEIRECDFGSWEGLTANEVREKDPDAFGNWVADDAFAPPGGESWTQVGDRVNTWWSQAAERYDDRTVLAVTHGGPILCLARHVTQGPYLAMFSFEIDPCSVTVIQNRRRLWRLRLLNDTTHIADPLREGPPPEGMPP
jgi:probable phosphoglycerate mutase